MTSHAELRLLKFLPVSHQLPVVQAAPSQSISINSVAARFSGCLLLVSLALNDVVSSSGVECG